MKILLIIAYLLIIRFILKNIYFYFKFKRDSKFPCFVVISQDWFISKPMYYDDAKKYSDRIYGTIKVDRKEFKRLKRLKKQSLF
jgi:hypothetical protein